MTRPRDAASPEGREDEIGGSDGARYELMLYVSGASALSARAIANARRLCDICMDGRYQLSVVDVHDDVTVVHASGVLATPTLVKNRPLPVRRFVGDLSHTDKVVSSLGLPAADATPTANG